MNRKEWRELYGAARMLNNVKFSIYAYSDKLYKTQQCDIAWDIAYKAICEMGYGIKDAVYYYDSCCYDIKEGKWAIKHNSKVFNRRMPRKNQKIFIRK